MTHAHIHRLVPDFRIDYYNKQAVIGLAQALGPGHSVVKADNRRDYHVIHTASENKPRIGAITVVHRT